MKGGITRTYENMIYIRFDSLDFENELLEVVKLFFPENEIAIGRKEASPEQEGLFLCGGIIRNEGSICYAIRLEGAGTGRSSHMLLADTDTGLTCSIQLPGGVPGKALPEAGVQGTTLSEAIIPGKTLMEARKIFKRDIRRGIYAILSEYSGKHLPWGMLTGIRPAKIVHELLQEGCSKNEITARLMDYFMVSDSKSELLYDVAAAERDILEKSPHDSVSVYIGIPFCRTRCLYCSFASNPVARYKGHIVEYIKALKVEIKCTSEIMKSRGMKIQSIYIGGGTPTSIDAQALQGLLDYIGETFDMSCLQEYTLEAGRPDSIDIEKLRIIKNSGAGRISINPQTMDAGTLRLIGREHSPEDVVSSFKLAREAGFCNINMDLITGLPGEDAGIFANTLEQVRRLGPESLTVHALAVKRASRLNEEKEAYPLCPEEEAFKMADLAQEYARKTGMHPYYLYRQKNILGNLENIGFCKPGFECIYNIQIMEERQTIIALGAGAVTKVVYPSENRIERAFNVKSVEEYTARVDEMIDRKKKLFADN